MKTTRTILILLVLFVSVSCQKGKERNTVKKTNVIYILADDLGYGDLGSFGQEKIETPNLDELARNGVKFTQHYSGAPVCAPARAVLLTGQHLGHSQVRGNDEWAERGNVWNYEESIKDQKLEGQRPLKEGTITLGSLFQSEGYKTGVIGKWGLGAPNTEGVPNEQGFDYFYGFNCQRQAHTYYPYHLYRNNDKVILDNEIVAPHSKLNEGDDPYKAESYSKFNLKEYASTLMFDEVISFVDKNKEEPFFLYWASPIPHVPLQAPKKWVDYYHEKFGEEEPYVGKSGYFPVRYPKATYAAMISYLDENIGKLIQHLKDIDEYENTIIIFSSDNGPTFNGGTLSPWFNSGGLFDSVYGKGKGFLTEGGIRVPMIVSWPEKIKEGRVTDHVSSFYDVLPTVSDLLEVKTPPTDGISFLPTLLNEEKNQKKHDFLYWEFYEYGGQVAVRYGSWKYIIKNAFDETKTSYHLYNLETDIKEEKNLYDNYPNIVKKIEEIIKNEHTESNNPKWRMSLLGDNIIQ